MGSNDSGWILWHMVESEVRVMATFNVKQGKRGLPVAI